MRGHTEFPDAREARRSGSATGCARLVHAGSGILADRRRAAKQSGRDGGGGGTAGGIV